MQDTKTNSNAARDAGQPQKPTRAEINRHLFSSEQRPAPVLPAVRPLSVTEAGVTITAETPWIAVKDDAGLWRLWLAIRHGAVLASPAQHTEAEVEGAMMAVRHFAKAIELSPREVRARAVEDYDAIEDSCLDAQQVEDAEADAEAMKGYEMARRDREDGPRVWPGKETVWQLSFEGDHVDTGYALANPLFRTCAAARMEAYRQAVENVALDYEIEQSEQAILVVRPDREEDDEERVVVAIGIHEVAIQD